MEWWEQYGSMAMGLPEFPALAHDMHFNGPKDDFRYTLAGYLNGSALPINVYPVEGE